jgi:hypothetical protein
LHPRNLVVDQATGLLDADQIPLGQLAVQAVVAVVAVAVDDWDTPEVGLLACWMMELALVDGSAAPRHGEAIHLEVLCQNIP